MVARHAGKREQPQNCSPACAPRWAVRSIIDAPHCGQEVFGLALGDSDIAEASEGLASCTVVSVPATTRNGEEDEGPTWTDRTRSANCCPSTRSIGFPWANVFASWVKSPEVMTTAPWTCWAVITPKISRTTWTPTLSAFHCLHCTMRQLPSFFRTRSTPPSGPRSEERRVAKECRSRWSPYH